WENRQERQKAGLAFRGETHSNIKRALRRLGDLSQRGDLAMGPDEREALSKFIESPYKSFLSHKTGQYLASILENMRRAIDSGKMEFKPKKTGRVSAQLKQLTGTSHLGEKQEKGRRLLARRRELLHNPQVKEMYQWRKGLLLKIEEARRQEQDVEERMRSVASMADALNRRLQ